MAVINKRTEILTSIRWIQGLLIVYLMLLCGVTHAELSRCDNVQAEFRNKGYTAVTLPDKSTKGPICGENSCCGPEFEMRLMTVNRNYTERFVRGSVSKLVSLFETRARRFDDFFRKMMADSKREFHDMFQKTYGVVYLQNSDVFHDFFDQLDKYYSKGKTRLDDTMDTFFVILYQRMFKVINAQYDFNETYLACVADHMAELKPFEDVPHKLGVQLRRSFVATRTFYLALQKGAAIAENMHVFHLDETCASELVSMRQCGFCKGESSAVPCLGYCVNTLQNCLRHYITAMDNIWDDYVDAIEKVADRLAGPFNIEMVVQPINIKISEAIMNFQEKGAQVSENIFTGCGKPSLGRSRRSTNETKPNRERRPNDEIAFESLNFHKKKHKKQDNVPEFEKLIRDIKSKVKETRQFWSHLPYQFCNEENVTVHSNPNETCWNGTHAYPKSTPASVPLTIQEELYGLQVMIGKLQGAYQGQDVDLADEEVEEPLEGSGSGSGDGYEDVASGNGDDEKEAVNVPVETAPPPPSTTRPPDKTRKTSSSGGESISLTRALVSYLLPIVMVWFGGAITDLL